MKMHVALTCAGFVGAIALVAVGCKKDEPEPNTAANFQQQQYPQQQQQYPQQQYPQQQYPQQQYPAGTVDPNAAATAAPANTGFFGLPIAIPGLTTGATGGTTAQTGTPANNTAQSNPSVAMLGSSLVPLQQQYAPGSVKEGDAIGGVLNEGQSATVQVNLQPGKCYTGIGAGAPTISELVVDLIAGAPLNQVLSTSQPGSMQTVMAAQPNCFKNPLPIAAPATFRVTAKRGSGPAIAQLYAK